MRVISRTHEQQRKRETDVEKKQDRKRKRDRERNGGVLIREKRRLCRTLPPPHIHTRIPLQPFVHHHHTVENPPIAIDEDFPPPNNF